MNYIDGVIRLISPLNSAQPAFGKKGKKENGTETVKQPVFFNGRTIMVPYFPANDFRGRLRRKAALYIFEALHHKGHTIPLELYSGLTCGASSASPESDVTVREVLDGRNNVYLGIFGGGTRLLRSAISVHDIVPVTQETLSVGMVPAHAVPETLANLTDDPGEKDKEEGENAGKFRTMWHRRIFRINDATMMVRPDEVMKYVTDPEKSVTDAILKDLKNSQERSESKDAGEEVEKKTGLRNMVDVESIRTGTHLYFRISLAPYMTEAQIGLLLMSLRDLFREQALGGFSRMGFGRYTVEAANLAYNSETYPIFEGREGESLAINDTDAFLAECLDAASQEIGGLTLESLAEFFTPKKPPKKEKTEEEKAKKKEAKKGKKTGENESAEEESGKEESHDDV